MGEIFANEANDKGLISKLYKQLLKHNINQSINQSIKIPASENGQKFKIDISPKKTYRWPRGT